MKNLRVATVQFENKSGDKEYNLSIIDNMAQQASASGADASGFPLLSSSPAHAVTNNIRMIIIV